MHVRMSLMETRPGMGSMTEYTTPRIGFSNPDEALMAAGIVEAYEANRSPATAPYATRNVAVLLSHINIKELRQLRDDIRVIADGLTPDVVRDPVRDTYPLLDEFQTSALHGALDWGTGPYRHEEADNQRSGLIAIVTGATLLKRSLDDVARTAAHFASQSLEEGMSLPPDFLGPVELLHSEYVHTMNYRIATVWTRDQGLRV